MPELWDENGTPLYPHVMCPVCHDESEVGSNYDCAWCCICGWHDSLTKQREAAKCAHCGKEAACFGVYEGCYDDSGDERKPEYACDTCCLHGNEDGWCKPVVRSEDADA
jgi:hypothetical protein